MLYQRATLIELTIDRETDIPLKSFREGMDPIIVDAQVSPSNVEYAESEKRSELIIESARKVLSGGQVAIIVVVPHIVHWVSEQASQRLSSSATDVNVIAEALEPKLGGPNSELVAEHVVRASMRAELGIQNRISIELLASSARQYKADLDCYFDDPDLHAILALLTPLRDHQKFLGYEEAQLSSIRYHLGVLNTQQDRDRAYSYSIKNNPYLRDNSRHLNTNSRDNRGPHFRVNKSHTGPSSYGSEVPPKNHVPGLSKSDPELDRNYGSDWSKHQGGYAISDFIPSMHCRELEYFYAMLPRSATGMYSRHELELARLQSIGEQEQQAQDPDDMDPHQRMRLLQQRSMSPVTPRRPRDLAEVQAELERSRMIAKSFNDNPHHSSRKHGDIRCMECGTDTSPEWRKGPNGPKTLCNRCGLRFAKKLRMQKS